MQSVEIKYKINGYTIQIRLKTKYHAEKNITHNKPRLKLTWILSHIYNTILQSMGK